MLKALFVALVYLGSIVSVILFWRDNILLSFIILILSVIALAVWHKKNDIITFLLGIIFGWFSESVCIYFGAWKYTNPTYLVPLWLPLLWGIAAFTIRRFTLRIEKR